MSGAFVTSWQTPDGFHVDLWRGGQSGRLIAKIRPPQGWTVYVTLPGDELRARACVEDELQLLRTPAA